MIYGLTGFRVNFLHYKLYPEVFSLLAWDPISPDKQTGIRLVMLP